MMKQRKIYSGLAAAALALCVLLCRPAFAAEVPLSQTERNIDGQQILEQIYEVPQTVDPQSLIAEDLIQNGYVYEMTSITKEPLTDTETKTAEQTQSVTISLRDKSAAEAKALQELPSCIEYDTDGYTGKLYPVTSTLKGTETGRTTHSGSKTVKKSYTYDYNDDGQVPQSSDGYALSSVTWTESNAPADDIEGRYTAHAVYSKPYSYTTINGWQVEMTYRGEVERQSTDTVRYTVTYTGQRQGILTGLDEKTGAAIGKLRQILHDAPLRKIGGILCLLFALFTPMIALMILYSGKIRVYAEEDGVYRKLPSITYNGDVRRPIVLDTLDAPSAERFRLVFSRGLTRRLDGETVIIAAAQRRYWRDVTRAAGGNYITEIVLPEPWNDVICRAEM